MAKTIVGILDWGLTPQQAIELPKALGMSQEIVTALEAKGHKVRRSKGEFSGLHIIYRNEDGTLTGGADPRREGTAVGF